MEKPRVFILAGTDEDYLMHKSFEVVENNRKKGIQHARFYLLENSFKELTALLNQSSLLGGGEFIWVRDAQLLKDNEIKELKSSLEKEISRQLLMTAVEKRKSLLSRWKQFNDLKGVKLKIFEELGLKELARDLVKIAFRFEKTLTDAAAEMLLKRCQRNFGIASGELKKLIYYFFDRKTLTVNEVQAYVKELPSDKLFNFIDALLQRELPDAVKKLEDVLVTGEKPEAVFYVLLSTFTNYIQAATLFKLGVSVKEVLSTTGLEEWQINNYKRSSRKWSWDELVEAYWQLLSFDSKIKTGEIRNPKDALKCFLSVLTAPQS